jgi:hypothetical protein
MKHGVIVSFFFLTSFAVAHNSYTGGYSGAPGMRSCASSCHGGTSGTLVVNGFPASYIPGQTYRLTIAHAGGSPIVNFNLTTRQSSTGSVAGTFSPLSNCTSFTGTDGGVYASPHSIDSAVVNWTAPAKGSGTVTAYASAFQGSTSSSSGQSRSLSISASEILTSVGSEQSRSHSISLSHNYPNPFNPSTTISFSLPSKSFVSLKVIDALGREVSTLLSEELQAGTYSCRWESAELPSGAYFYRLQTAGHVETKRMTLLR